MTEAEWNNCTDPILMLASLRGELSDRKLRLFTCACLRRVWHSLPNESFREAILETEQIAERTGAMPPDAVSWWRRLDFDQAFSTLLGERDVYDSVTSLLLVAAHTHADAQVASWLAAHAEADPVWRSHVAKSRRTSARREEASVQACLLRDVAGVPRRRTSLEPALLRWNEGTVVKLARAAYDEQLLPEGTLHPSRLAVLADALEEAGCTDPDVLSHGRQQGAVHLRGCWLIDLLLNKE
jgi:hypothetical protein